MDAQHDAKRIWKHHGQEHPATCLPHGRRIGRGRCACLARESDRCRGSAARRRRHHGGNNRPDNSSSTHSPRRHTHFDADTDTDTDTDTERYADSASGNDAVTERHVGTDDPYAHHHRRNTETRRNDGK
jgi:hypothetical protein